VTKWKWILYGGAVPLLLVVALVCFKCVKQERGVASTIRAAWQSAEIPDNLTRQEPVGWVFGRIVGVPAADRPLTGQLGSFRGAPLPPSQARSRN
jgi:hypothetical protein